MVSQDGTDTQKVVPGSSDEMRQQSSGGKNNTLVKDVEGPVIITFPSSKCRLEVSCIVCVCPQTFYKYHGCSLSVMMVVVCLHKTTLLGEWKLGLWKPLSKEMVSI